MNNFHYEIGQRVEREIDIYHPEKGKRKGMIIKCYSKRTKKVGDLILGPYPELYEVYFDDGTRDKGFFWFGLNPI